MASPLASKSGKRKTQDAKLKDNEVAKKAKTDKTKKQVKANGQTKAVNQCALEAAKTTTGATKKKNKKKKRRKRSKGAPKARLNAVTSLTGRKTP